MPEANQGPLAHREPVTAPPATPRATLDSVVTSLAANKTAWAQLDALRRVALLDEVLHDVNAIGERWVAASVAAKGLAPGTPGEGEEWLQFAIVPRLLRRLRIALAEIAASGRPHLPRPLTQRSDGRVVATVYPMDRWDRFALPGISGEVWMTPGQSVAEVAATQADAYRQAPGEGKLTLVLAAGNASPLVPGDFLHHLFVERAVVLLKMNPVNAYLGPIIEAGFGALIRQGALAVVYGGAEVGAYLCQHGQVDAIHMTGADKTFDSIVFGPAGAQHKAQGTPLITKPVSAELGNITPVIVVPGPWGVADIEAQASRLAAQFAINAAFNCLTPRLLVQWQGWPQAPVLLNAVHSALTMIPPRLAYYPGAMERHAAFVAAHPAAEQIGAPAPDALPWTLIRDVPAAATDDICFRTESFCSVLAETSLAAADPVEFVRRAVAFVNDHVWGTLVAILLVHPATAKDPEMAGAVERAISDLRYGTVVVNQPSVLAYMLCTAPWGSFPGQPLTDIQSGRGFVNNPLMFAQPEKSVVRGPFRQQFDAFQPEHRHLAQFGRCFAGFQAHPSAGELARAIWYLMRP